MTRLAIRALDWLNRKGKSAGIRLVQVTGKSPHRIHPKHLVEAPWHEWYLDYLKPADRVLDLGCGHGEHAFRVCAAGCANPIIGMDYDADALDVAKTRLWRLERDVGPLGMAFLESNITQHLPFPEAYFNAVLCLDVIEHLVPRQAVLREIHRVLTPDGVLLISAPNRLTTWRRRLRDAGLFAFSDPDHKVEYSAEEFLSELADAAFVAERLLPIVYDTPWAGLIDALGGLSLTLYARLSRWKRDMALRHPEESTGFRAVARKRRA